MVAAKQYDEEFKKQAIKLAKEIGNKAAANELGIPKGTLGTWLHKARKSYDLLKRDFRADKPLEKAVTDISELKAKDGKVYVSCIFDCYDLMPLGLAIDDNYYYCSERYNVTLKEDGIRLAGDEIPVEEWEDPVVKRTDLPTPPRSEISNSLNLITAAGLENDTKHTVYSVAIAESEFMRFNIENDGSPGTMVSLLLSRAIAKLFSRC